MSVIQVLSLALSVVPAVGPDASPPATGTAPCPLMVAGPCDQMKSGQMFFVMADGDDAEPAGPIAFRFVHGDPDKNSADGETATIKWIGESPPQAGGPWLGVQFGPVPKATRAQLGIEAGAGQMILNVIEGSPADLAGLQQYDIIQDFGGKPTPADMGEFLSIIRGYKPNQGVGLTVIRGGQRVAANMTIGARPDDMTEPKYKYELDAEELSQGRTFGRSGLLEKDAQGNWVFKGFNLKDLPDVWKAVPGIDENDFMWTRPLPGGPGGNQIYVHKDQGKTVKIEKAADGKITVTTTTTENGQANTTTKTYANEQELEAADPDAHKMLSGAGPFRFHFLGDDGSQMDFFPPDVRIRMEEAFKNMPGMMTPDDPSAPSPLPHRMGIVSRRKATTTFETTPQGRIKVITRKGDDELVQEYENAEALRAAQPELYRKYDRLQSRAATAPQK